MGDVRHRQPDRRRFIVAGAAAGATLAAAPLFAPALRAQERAIKLGYVSPQTGPLAPFAEADAFVLDGVRRIVGDGVDIRGTTTPVEVIVKDSQSNPNRAADVAKELIVDDEVDLVLVASTPETTNPVATQCEIEGVPCISSVAPWQPYFIGRQRRAGRRARHDEPAPIRPAVTNVSHAPSLWRLRPAPGYSRSASRQRSGCTPFCLQAG